MKRFVDVYPSPYPSTHRLGARVPHGGSSCASCRFAKVVRGAPYCMNDRWARFPRNHGGGGGRRRLPVHDPSDYCCDLYETSGRLR